MEQPRLIDTLRQTSDGIQSADATERERQHRERFAAAEAYGAAHIREYIDELTPLTEVQAAAGNRSASISRSTYDKQEALGIGVAMRSVAEHFEAEGFQAELSGSDNSRVIDDGYVTRATHWHEVLSIRW